MFNLTELAAQTGLEEGELLEMLQTFVEVSESDLAVLQAAVGANSARQAIESAHSLKGAALSFGFQELYDIARAIEADARRGVLEGNVERARLLGEMISGIAATLRMRVGS